MTTPAEQASAGSPERAEQILQRADWAMGAYARFDRAAVLRIAEAAANWDGTDPIRTEWPI